MPETNLGTYLTDFQGETAKNVLEKSYSLQQIVLERLDTPCARLKIDKDQFGEEKELDVIKY